MKKNIKIPKILNIPPKLLEFVFKFNNYRIFLAEGGRGSGKTQSVGRLILYICEKKKIRVVCGREIQSTIEDSVYKVLVDLINEFGLNYKISKNKIVHNVTGSEIVFKGFREQGSVNIKGLEGIDLLWIDEAESIAKQTLDIVVPTIRRPKSKIFFTMNRKLINDPVYDFCNSNEKCLKVSINYFDNPFCSKELIDEAERCKETNERDYRHIWLGEPLDQSSDRLFSSNDIARMANIAPFGDIFQKIRVIGIDFAAQGGDFCVATVLDKVSPVHWDCVQQISWQDSNPMASIGKIVEIIGDLRPDKTILDCGGMGFVVFSRLQELGIRIEKFDGSTTQGVPAEYANARAFGYYSLAEYLRNGWIKMNSPETEKELIEIRFKYRSNGERIILSKDEMRRRGIHSPDRADSLMMAIYCIKTCVLDGSMNGDNFVLPERVARSKWQI